MSRFDVIAFDADDTLWQNERNFMNAQGRFRTLLSAYHSKEWVDERLYEAEVRNLPHFGYGVKAFALSMIETAIELTEGRVSSGDIKSIIDTAREMISADVELLDHVVGTLSALSRTHELMLITKGDLRDQESKLARSGLASHFRHVEIVSDKRPGNYAAIQAVPNQEFKAEILSQEELFLKLAGNLPKEIIFQRELLITRL